MMNHKISTISLSLIACVGLLFSQQSFAEHHYKQKSYSHGYKNKHHKLKRHFRHHYKAPVRYRYNYPVRYVHHEHHNGAAIIGGAILGAVIVSAIDNDHNNRREKVTVVNQSAPPQLIYRQLADGSCYRVSYDANGTEYLQRVGNDFCGYNNN